MHARLVHPSLRLTVRGLFSIRSCAKQAPVFFLPQRGHACLLVQRNLFNLAVPLLARLANHADPVDPHLLIVPLALDHKHDQAGDVLKLDEAQLDLRGARGGVPVLGLQRDLLRGRHVGGVVEAEDPRLVGEDLEHARPRRRFLV